MIQFDHLTKEYDGVTAVKDLTTEIPQGQIFGLLGPNGAGKSTTILMLIGLIEPTEGRCLINGVEVAKNPIRVKQDIGYMPEDVGFYSTLTAKENLTYFAKLFHMDYQEYHKRIPDLISLVGLDGVTKNVGEYSKGMRQRLGIANALLNDPSVVILDEPTANLDPQGVADYRKIVQGLAQEGKTVIVSSHILPEVSKVCTSIGLLMRGRLLAQGKWEDLNRMVGSRDCGNVTIIIETREPMPDLHQQEILSISYSDDRKRATFIARSDIRDDLIDSLSVSGTRIRELSLKSTSLEDLFLSYYQVAG